MKTIRITAIALISVLISACSSTQNKIEEQPVIAAPAENAQKSEEMFFNEIADEPEAAGETASDTSTGYASWYGKELQGKPTASGELFDLNKYTAAHRDLPMGTVLLIKNRENGRKQLVRVNDRGPYVDGRIIDVSYAAARDLGFAEKGVAKVEIEVIQRGQNDFMSKAALPVEEKTEEVSDFDEVTTVIADPFEESDRNDEPATDVFTFADGLAPEGYTVQTGAFMKRANAEKLRTELEEQYNRRGFIAGRGKWHLVWLGDFKTSEKARSFFDKLKADGIEVMYRGKIDESEKRIAGRS